MGNATLFVLDVLGRSLPIERENLQFPADWHRGWQIADIAVASLIMQLSRDRNGPPFRSQRVPEIRGGVYPHILTDVERALEDGHSLLDRWQIENFGPWINHRRELHHRRRINHQFNGDIAPRSWRVDMDIGRELDLG